METKTSDKETAKCAAAASAITKSVLHPIDTVKCRLQAYEHTKGVRQFVKHYEGKWTPRYLYSGLGIKIVMYVPFQSIYMTTYTATKRHLNDSPLPLWAIVTASSVVADLAAAVVRVPMEAAKMRLQSTVYGNARHALRDLRAGGVRPMLRLVLPQVIIHDLPYGFAVWIGYEYLTPVVRAALFGDGESKDGERPIASLVSGCITGCIAGAVTVPLDVIKTRTVVKSVDRTISVSVSGVVKNIYATQGAKGFTRGVSARMLWISANLGMYLSTFELLKEVRRRRLSAGSTPPIVTASAAP